MRKKAANKKKNVIKIESERRRLVVRKADEKTSLPDKKKSSETVVTRDRQRYRRIGEIIWKINGWKVERREERGILQKKERTKRTDDRDERKQRSQR